MSRTDLIYLVFAVLVLFGVWYARKITLRPFDPGRMWASIVIGVLVTNTGIGLILAAVRPDPGWFLYPHLYFLAGGLLALLIYRFRLSLEILPTSIQKKGWFEELNQTWFYTTLGCIPPLAAILLHLYLAGYGWKSMITPVLCYVLTGGPMIVAQDLKWKLQRANGFLLREIIKSHREERDTVIHGD
jgi:hypothetical protein